MELFQAEKLHNDSDGMSYAVQFNHGSRKAAKSFDLYMSVLGQTDAKFDRGAKTWKVDGRGYEMLVRLDAKLFPPKKKTPKKSIIRYEQKNVGDTSDLSQLTKYPLYEYQKKVVKFCLDAKEALVVSGCGSGKTLMMLDTYLEAVNRKIISGPGMIVVKASLKVQWVHR